MKRLHNEDAFTLVELLTAIAIIGLLGALSLPALARARESARRAACQSNLKQFALIFKGYASEHHDLLPPLAPYSSVRNDNFSSPLFAAPSAKALIPDYLTDTRIAQCPSDSGGDPGWLSVAARLPDTGDFRTWQQDAERLGDSIALDYFLSAELSRSYLYKGYLATSPEEYYGIWGATTWAPVQASADIPGVGMVRMKDFDADLDLDAPLWPPWVPISAMGSAGGDMVFRLREGIGRFLITDINNPADSAAADSVIPVLWDLYGSGEFSDNDAGSLTFNHLPGGANVLYLDGHAEFRVYPSTFPVLDAPPLVKEISHYGIG